MNNDLADKEIHVNTELDTNVIELFIGFLYGTITDNNASLQLIYQSKLFYINKKQEIVLLLINNFHKVLIILIYNKEIKF